MNKNAIKINKSQIKDIQNSLKKINIDSIQRKYKQKSLLNDCPICRQLKVHSEIKKKHVIFVFCRFIEIELFDNKHQSVQKIWIDINHNQILNTKKGEAIKFTCKEITKMFKDKFRNISMKKTIKIIREK